VLAALAVARPPVAFAAVQPSLQVVPQPCEVRAAGAGFEPAKARFICVSAGAADRFTARLLQEALRETHGVDGNVVLLPPQATNWHRLWLGASEPLPEVPERLEDKGDESYTLDVTGGGVLITAEGDTGLFYGAQTLIQLLEQGVSLDHAAPLIQPPYRRLQLLRENRQGKSRNGTGGGKDEG